MKLFAPTTWTLTGAWIALSAVAGAQSPDPTTGAPAPRVSTQPLEVSAPTFVGPAATPDALSTYPQDAVVHGERPEREHGEVMSLPASHERYSRVYWDTEEDGTIWVRGRNYKASFGAEGATYYPLLGSDQPRHFPLALSLASATSGGVLIPLAPVTGAVRDGDRVIIDRGGIDEVYEIGVESMEQTFVVEERPQGDLKLFVRLATEMGRTQNTDGFEFSNEFGGVRYSRAFLRGADGQKLPLSTRTFGSDLQIDVAAEDVATSSFPLVIDPVVSTFDVDVTTYDNFDPDLAYDATTDRYLYVYLERVTALDNDVFSEVVNGAGTVLGGAYVNLSAEKMREVSVANLNAYDQFMVAMTDSLRVVGRVTSASNIAYSTQFLIYSGQHQPRSLSVGGDSYGSAPAYYCVVWQRRQDAATIEIDVVARLVTNTGALLGPGPLELAATTHSEFDPKVSKGNNGIQWNVVWNRGPALPPGGGALYSEDVYGAQIAWNGTSITTPAFPILLGYPYQMHYKPSVSSPVSSGEYMVVWNEYVSPFNDDIRGARIVGGTVLSTMSISGLENAGNQALRQSDASVETDADRFLVAYHENVTSSDQRVYVASFALLPGEVRCLESHVPLSTPGVGALDATLVSTAASGGPLRRFALAWDEQASTTDRNIRGALFDALPVSAYCFGDGTGMACPCGNNGLAGRGCANSVYASGARLSTVGNPDVSSDNLVLQAIGMPNAASCLFFQGTTTGPNSGLGSIFGDGLRCTGGSTVRLAVKTTVLGTAYYPHAGDPSISVRGLVPATGGVRTYQVWYRNAAAFCTASTFNLTNGVRAVWLP